jgi:hypothetical protein
VTILDAAVTDRSGRDDAGRSTGRPERVQLSSVANGEDMGRCADW